MEPTSAGPTIKLIQYSYNSLLKEPYSLQALRVVDGTTVVDKFETFTQLEPFLEGLEGLVPLFKEESVVDEDQFIGEVDWEAYADQQYEGGD